MTTPGIFHGQARADVAVDPFHLGILRARARVWSRD